MILSQEDLLIYNKLYNLSSQTSEPGTLQNIKARFHHHKVNRLLKFLIFICFISKKASKDISNFYASWDLMEVTTLSNLVALAMHISGLDFNDDAVNYTEADLYTLVDAIYNKIDMHQKWNRDGMIPSTYFSSEHLECFFFMRNLFIRIIRIKSGNYLFIFAEITHVTK